VFYNSDRTSVAWVNDEDHLRIISTGEDGDIVHAFAKFCHFADQISHAAASKGFKFMHNEHLGFLTTCPSNLGTGLNASVLIQLPQINKMAASRKRSEQGILAKICDAFHLQALGSKGENTVAEGGKFLVSNKQRF